MNEPERYYVMAECGTIRGVGSTPAGALRDFFRDAERAWLADVPGAFAFVGSRRRQYALWRRRFGSEAGGS